MIKLEKLFLSSLLIICSLSAFSSDVKSVKFKGEVLLTSEDTRDALVYIYNGNNLIDSTKTTNSGSFEIELELGSVYTLEIKKAGYISKRLSINAQVKDPYKKVPSFNFLCELTEISSELYANEIDFPVTIIRMNERKGEFEHNASYTRSMNKVQNAIYQEMSQKFDF